MLKDINLQVQKGERIVICGPSGSGKSTAIRCINHLEEHQQGTIIIDGIDGGESSDGVAYPKAALSRPSGLVATPDGSSGTLPAGDHTYVVTAFNGTGETLEVSFSTDTSSVLNIDSVDVRVATTGLALTSAANFSLSSVIAASLAEIKSATETLRGEAQTLGSNIALLQTRIDFTETYVNVLEGGSDKLTLADITEEGANLVALQTRQQLGISALAFAGQAEQSVLQLFR